MEIEININSSEAVYLQIINQIRDGVRTGALKSGHSLPPVRQLASDLMINPNTVAKAYKQLEAQKVVRGAGRQGTFIEDNAAARVDNNNHEDAKHELDALLKSLRKRGLTAAQIKVILFDQIEKINDNKETAKQITFKGEGFSKKLPGLFSRKQKGGS